MRVCLLVPRKIMYYTWVVEKLEKTPMKACNDIDTLIFNYIINFSIRLWSSHLEIKGHWRYVKFFMSFNHYYDNSM